MVLSCDVVSLLGAQIRRVVICKVTFFVRQLVELLLAVFFVRDEHVFLRVDEVIGAGCEVPLAFFEHVLLDFFGDVDVVVLAPLGSLEVVSVAVVMPAVCSAFVDQQGVKVVRSLVYLLVGFLDLLLNLEYPLPVLLHPRLERALIRLQQLQDIAVDLLIQAFDEGRIVELIFSLHMVVLQLQEAVGLAKQIE